MARSTKLEPQCSGVQIQPNSMIFWQVSPLHFTELYHSIRLVPYTCPDLPKMSWTALPFGSSFPLMPMGTSLRFWIRSSSVSKPIQEVPSAYWQHTTNWGQVSSAAKRKSQFHPQHFQSTLATLLGMWAKIFWVKTLHNTSSADRWMGIIYQVNEW
jgi:hypothetical protein